MRVLTIAELKQLRHKEPIESFEGHIEKVYEQKSGSGQYGQWWLQNMIVKDETGKVQVTWGGQDDLSSLEGQSRRFESELSEKYGWQGCKWDVRTANGKHYEGVKLTESCKIKPLDGGACGNAYVPSKEGERQTSEAQPAARRDDPPPQYPDAMHDVDQRMEENRSWNGITEARQHLCQAANLYNLCVKAVDAMIAPNLPEVAQTSDQFQAATATLFIEASRTGFVAKMPKVPVPNGNEKVERPPVTKEEEPDIPF